MYKLFIKKIISVIIVISICSIPNCIYAADKEETIKPDDKISEDLYQEFFRLETEQQDLKKEKIPVWIWYEDINQKQVDREVTEQTRLTQENLSADFKMPDSYLINALQNRKIGSQEKMREYLGRTSVARELEKQRVDEYVVTRRNISRGKYKENFERIKKGFHINKSNIIYSSSYAPVVMVELTKEQIYTIATDKLVESIGLYKNVEVQDSSLDSIKNSIGITNVYSQLGLNGNHVKIGMIEGGSPESVPGFDNSHIIVVGNNVAEKNHATGTAIILEGVAPEATIYSTNCDPANVELMLDQGVKVINMSAGYSKNVALNLYNFWNKWANQIGRAHV